MGRHRLGARIGVEISTAVSSSVVKILLVNSGLRHGGAETQIIYLCHAFIRMGHEVALYLLTSEADRLLELPPTVRVIRGRKSRPFDVAELLRLRRFMQRWRPDVVKSFLFDANFYARLAAVGTDLPVINGERNDGYKLNRNQAAAHRLTRRLADAVVANTHAGRAFAQRMFDIPAPRTHVVWNGIDLAKVQGSLPSPEHKQRVRREVFGEGPHKVVVVVGTIRRSKDHLLALKVCKSLHASDSRWRFLFVGEALAPAGKYASKEAGDATAYKQEVLEYVRANGLEALAFFVGKRDDSIRLIASADVLLSTSVHEGFPNVVLEAMAAGTPVVSTAYSDIARILPREWQVAPDRAPETLAKLVDRAFSEHDAVAEAQRAFVEQQATVDISARRMLAVFQQYSNRNATRS